MGTKRVLTGLRKTPLFIQRIPMNKKTRQVRLDNPASIIAHSDQRQPLKAIRLRSQYFLNMPTGYRHADKSLRQVMVQTGEHTQTNKQRDG